MLAHETPNPAQPVLLLQGELTIYRAAELKPLLLADVLPQVVDVSGVTEIDSAGVQLLMQSKKMALQAQRPWRLVSCSEAVLEVVALLNLFDFFDMPGPGVSHES